MISAQDLSCSVDGRTVLEHVNFTAPTGKMTAILGENGVGKSTLLRCLAGITAPLRGAVTIGERDLHALRPRARARELAYVAQEETPPAELTVREAVELGRLPHTSLWNRGSAAEREVVQRSLEALGIGELGHRNCDELSGGQRRRVVLARALAQQTGALLLDEPVANLDVNRQLHVLEVARAAGATVVATMHELDLAMTQFDHVLVLQEGGVAAAGPPLEVLTPELVARVFAARSALVDAQGHRHVVVTERLGAGHPQQQTNERE